MKKKKARPIVLLAIMVISGMYFLFFMDNEQPQDPLALCREVLAQADAFATVSSQAVTTSAMTGDGFAVIARRCNAATKQSRTKTAKAH